ncbi:hypothetical protein MTO96_014576 [Rhipicephalus appendiculatus]
MLEDGFAPLLSLCVFHFAVAANTRQQRPTEKKEPRPSANAREVKSGKIKIKTRLLRNGKERTLFYYIDSPAAARFSTKVSSTWTRAKGVPPQKKGRPNRPRAKERVRGKRAWSRRARFLAMRIKRANAAIPIRALSLFPPFGARRDDAAVRDVGGRRGDLGKGGRT